MNLAIRELCAGRCLRLVAMVLLAPPCLATTTSASPQHPLAAQRAIAMKPVVRARQAYPAMFREAYRQHPALPPGSLEAIAWEQSRWHNLHPEPLPAGLHRHTPPAWGLMGLYHGHGFEDQVAEAARLTGLSPRAIMNDPQASILAAAALLERALHEARAQADAGADPATVYAEALQGYAGFGSGDGDIQSFARQSFAYAVLTSLKHGIRRNGVRVPRQAIDLERAFKPQRLRLLRAPSLTMDREHDRIGRGDSAAPMPSAPLPPETAPHATLATDYPGAIWNPAYWGNYSNNWNSDTAVIIHSTEGSYASAIAWFQDPNAEVSAHYVIRQSDGQITQMVRERDTAWHAAWHNDYSIGIEHEAVAADASSWTNAMIQASAALVRDICADRGIDCATAWPGPGFGYWHVVDDSYRIKGHGMLTRNQNRHDPGAYFPWADYYNLLNGQPPTPVAPTYWVDTWADADGFPSPTSTAPSGTLYQGINYVYCIEWGRKIGDNNAWNHWWMKTDLDVGPVGQWVSAYNTTGGNDEAKTTDGYDLPQCHLLPYGAIAAWYYGIDGIRGVLGVPTQVEMDAQLGGRFQQFANGIMIWHPNTGAHAIHGDILDRFWATGGECAWGFPTMDEMQTGSPSPVTGEQGRYQYFEMPNTDAKALMLWTPSTGAHVVHGAIRDYFGNHGLEAHFGFASSDELLWRGIGRKQQFEQYTLFWYPGEGVHAVPRSDFIFHTGFQGGPILGDNVDHCP